MKTLDLSVPYTPFKGQQDFHDSRKPYRLLACGRRWGKDRCSVNEGIRLNVEWSSELRPGLIPKFHNWIVAPTYKLALQIWNELKFFTPKEILEKKPNDSTMSLSWSNGSLWEVRSADNASNLVSVGLDLLIMTEASKISEEAWLQSLFPCLLSPGRKGYAILNGTPRGMNWFHAAYLKGQEPESDWQSWNYPSNNSPYFTKKAFEKAKREMPELFFEQEIQAKFLQDGGVVFRNVRSCAVLKGDEIPQGDVVLGIDLGKHRDFTVLTGMDEAGNVIYWERFNKIDWQFQESRIIEVVRAFNSPPVVLDATGLGDPIYDSLTARGLDVIPYKFTVASKDALIRHLSISLDKKEIRYPDNPILIGELDAFTYQKTPGGNYTYSAPEGHFDDCVTSLGLANWGRVNAISKAEVIYP